MLEPEADDRVHANVAQPRLARPRNNMAAVCAAGLYPRWLRQLWPPLHVGRVPERRGPVEPLPASRALLVCCVAIVLVADHVIAARDALHDPAASRAMPAIDALPQLVLAQLLQPRLHLGHPVSIFPLLLLHPLGARCRTRGGVTRGGSEDQKEA